MGWWQDFKELFEPGKPIPHRGPEEIAKIFARGMNSEDCITWAEWNEYWSYTGTKIENLIKQLESKL